MESYQTVIIVGETGCGKTTQVPQVGPLLLLLLLLLRLMLLLLLRLLLFLLLLLLVQVLQLIGVLLPTYYAGTDYLPTTPHCL